MMTFNNFISRVTKKFQRHSPVKLSFYLHTQVVEGNEIRTLIRGVVCWEGHILGNFIITLKCTSGYEFQADYTTLTRKHFEVDFKGKLKNWDFLDFYRKY